MNQVQLQSAGFFPARVEGVPPVPTFPETGLLHYWPLDHATSDMVGALTLTDSGSSGFRYVGVKNFGFYCANGGNITAGSIGLNWSDPFSLVLWVRPEGSTDTDLVKVGTSPLLSISSGDFIVTLGDTADPINLGAAGTGSWNLIIVSYDGAGTASASIYGGAYSTASVTTPFAGTDLIFGSADVETGWDELAVFDRELTEDECADIWAGGSGLFYTDSGSIVTAPSNLQVTANGYWATDLAWDDNSLDETDMQVWRTTVLNGAYGSGALASLGADAVSYADTGLTEGATYYYAVGAKRGHRMEIVTGNATTDAFTPPQTGNLKLWLRASSLTGYSEGGSVNPWPDESGNGNDMVQVDASHQPAYDSAAANGFPAVYFDGTDYMSCSPPISSATVQTMVVVLSFNNPASGSIETPFKNGNSFGFALLKTAGGNREVLIRAVADCVDGAVSGTGIEVWAARTTGAPLTSLRVNGSAVAVTNSGATPVAPDGGTQLAHFNGGTFPFVGRIYEVYYYDIALSDADVALIEAYVALKYDL